MNQGNSTMRIIPYQIAIMLVILSMVIPQCRDKNQHVADLMNAWRHSDGAGVLDVADSLFQCLLICPNDFYRHMSNDSVSFRRFIGILENGIFRNFSDTSISNLEERRKYAILVLDKAQVDEVYRSMNMKMIQKLKTIQSSYVD